jgi:hypothetical protein
MFTDTVECKRHLSSMLDAVNWLSGKSLFDEMPRNDDHE